MAFESDRGYTEVELVTVAGMVPILTLDAIVVRYHL
jgi:hypothetical protein